LVAGSEDVFVLIRAVALASDCAAKHAASGKQQGASDPEAVNPHVAELESLGSVEHIVERAVGP
jgi:hypothetical protein